MKSDQEIMQSIRAAIDDCTRGIDNAPSLQYQIARKAKGEEPVVKKISATGILVIALIAVMFHPSMKRASQRKMKSSKPKASDARFRSPILTEKYSA